MTMSSPVPTVALLDTNNDNNNANTKQTSNVISFLAQSNLSKEEQSTFCKEHGICPGCGVKTHVVGRFRRTPIHNDHVKNGVCVACGVGSTATNGMFSSPWTKLTTRIPEISKAHAVGNVVGNAMGTALTKLQGGIDNATTKINNVSASIAANNNTFSHAVSPAKGEAAKDQSSLTNNENNNNGNDFTENGNIKFKGKQTENTGLMTIELGMEVCTPYGVGTVVNYREADKIYVVEITHQHQQQPKTTLYCPKGSSMLSAIDNHDNDDSSSSTPIFIKKKRAMELNEAYESLERMRRMNLEVQCMEKNVPYVDPTECTTCLLMATKLNNAPKNEKMQQILSQNKNKGITANKQQQEPQHFQRIRRFMKQSENKISTTISSTRQPKKPIPCLICASPSCKDHSCPNFRKENITVCTECVKYFELEYILDCVSSDKDDDYRKNQVNHIIDLYDRAYVLLKYSSQYINKIAITLEEQTIRANNVNLGGSSAGIVSGALGVAAAATIFTPAGPPLLIASLVFGGGATVAQTGTEAVNYFSEPKKVADRIIALHGMVHSLLRVTDTLREALTARLTTMKHDEVEDDEIKLSLQKIKTMLENNERAVIASSNAARAALLGSAAAAVGATATVAVAETAAIAGTTAAATTATATGTAVAAEGAAVAAAATTAATTSAAGGGAAAIGAEVGVLGARNANYLSKTGTAVARGARFARFAGGALSAATIILEAKTMSSTIQQIKAGNPCEKATTLRNILKEIDYLPTSDKLEEECQIYLGAMSNRIANVSVLEDAMRLIEGAAIREWKKQQGQHNSMTDRLGDDILLEEEKACSVVTDTGTDDMSAVTFSSSLSEKKKEEQGVTILNPVPDIVSGMHNVNDNKNDDHRTVLQVETGSHNKNGKDASQSMVMESSSPRSTRSTHSASSSLGSSSLLERIQMFKNLEQETAS